MGWEVRADQEHFCNLHSEAVGDVIVRLVRERVLVSEHLSIQCLGVEEVVRRTRVDVEIA